MFNKNLLRRYVVFMEYKIYHGIFIFLYIFKSFYNLLISLINPMSKYWSKHYSSWE